MSENLPDPDLSEIQEAMSPYVVERFALDDPEWQRIRRTRARKWRNRVLSRHLFGWMPDTRSLPAFLRGRRTQNYVRSSYEVTWSTHTWPETTSPVSNRQLSMVEWQNEGMKVRHGGVARAHLLVLARMVSGLQPRSVLEVGCGNGRNLFVLAGLCPDADWHGIDLTEAGIARAQAVQRDRRLPDPIREFAPLPVGDDTAFRRIQFRQGDATKLPYDDNSFDLVFTKQSLEQMEQVRSAALSEIARVARRYVVMIEPFSDFNQNPIQKNYVRAKDYFSLPVSGLQEFGINPVSATGQFPQNIQIGIGFVTGTVNKG